MILDTTKARIFVQIASYRDTECNPTIRDMFEQAAHPERIFAGVCWQFDPETDQKCFAVDYPRKKQVRTVEYHVKDAKGAGWARMEAQKLWQGEEYTLQIQAHHRFEPGWDDTLIELLHRIPTEKAVLTGWLPGYSPKDGKFALNARAPLAVVSHLGPAGDVQMVHYNKRDMMNDELFGKLLPACSWIGNFMFTRSETLEEVPFDPHIYFWGEEINYSVRLWTHGYDIYHLDRVVLYHYWNRHYKENNDAKDANIYRDHTFERNRLALERNLHVLGLKKSTDAAALVDIEQYGIGSERSVEDYWKFSGIDLEKRTIANHAKLGVWTMRDVPTPKSQRRVKRPRIFIGIASYRDPECQRTLKDLFAKAAHPERLHVGICLQIDPAEDKHCGVTPEYPNQVRVKQIHYNDSKGANWARAEALALREDEEYVLQIDSHMRFEQDWDEALLAALMRCPNPKKSVLSTYLPNYDPPDTRQRYPRSLIRLRVRKFGGDYDAQLLHVTGVVVFYEDAERVALYPSPFYIANFMLAPARVLDEVPIDPHFHFYGDELSYSARLWTHGWDIYQPDFTVMYHYWMRKETMHLQHYRNIRTEKSIRSYKRGMHLLQMEQSDDPQAIAELDKYGLGAERSLDDLWAFAGIDWQDRILSIDAEEGRWNMSARDKAQKKGKPKQQVAKQAALPKKPLLPRIFVQIASYRDPDCQNTVKDLFEKAAHPERIFIGICWQFVKGEDDICFQVPYPRPAQVRVRECDAHQSKGVCWARGITQELWEGEEFTLQIDSHMRFEQGWDDILLSMWEQCGSENAILTCYPPGFTPPDQLQREWVFGMAAKEFDAHGIFLMHGKPGFSVGELPARPIPGAFASACMYFGPGRMIKDVPYDPHLYFFGEEITLAVRFWTHGYDLFHPNQLCIYHDWDRNKRPTHFSDHKDWTVANDRAFRRVKHMLKTEMSGDPEITQELDIYGLGKKRSLEQYQNYSGVNFIARTFTAQAASGEYQPYSPKALASPVKTEARRDGSIYVQIASYRDRECQWTVKDLFEKAENPDRIFVGICWQFDEEADKDCFEISTRPDQVRVLPVDWREAEGVCWARNMTQQMWDHEEYTLMIDSHMRFIPGWDRQMIEELQACESQKPIITCSPAWYTPPNTLEPTPRPAIRRVNQFQPDGNLRGKGESIDRSPPKPLNGAFVAAGFVFSRSEVIDEVPYDPYLYFDQEEITYALRLYTHGWDVFSSRRHLLYHFYNTDHKDSVRPLHWRDLHKEDSKRIAFLRDRGLNRFNHITGYTVRNDFETIRELDKYGLGKERSLAQFEEYTGIDFKRKIASERALRCQFIRDLGKYRDKPIYVPELDGPNAPKQAAPVVAATPATPTQLNPVQEPAKTLNSYPMLEVGDFVPLFEAEDTNRKLRALELYGGKHCVLFFLPANKPDLVVSFFRNLSQQFAKHEKLDAWQIFILDDTTDNLIALKEKVKTPHMLWADPGRKIAQAFGICKPGDRELQPAGYLLSNNLRIISRHLGLNESKLAEVMVKDCHDALKVYQQKNSNPQVITELPPVVIIPNAFSPEFCKKCIDAFKSGETFEGTVGAEATNGYRPQAKVRTDFIVGGKLLEEIDEKMSRSIFPEITKIFGFDVTHREVYKIGLYTGEKGGFFKQHRDNFESPLGYRRVAMTIHLSDNYEGGGLRFPEYDENIYRPTLGSAIAFSGGTMHEARPVTSGERYVLVAFIHGMENEAYRRHYLQAKGSPTKAKDYIPTLRTYPELKISRDFYRNWYKGNAYLNEGAPAAQVITQAPAQPAQEAPAQRSNLVIQTLNGHQPKKVFESKSAIIFDDFLPEDVYQRVNNYALTADYEYINTKGKIARAWHVHDGFPLRTMMNQFYYAHDVQKPQGEHVYPTNTDLDLFTQHLVSIMPHTEHMVGKDGEWGHFSVTGWIYPHGTGLAMHDDGSGVYTGAFVYFLNPVWRPHWGGLLLMVDDEINKNVHAHRAGIDQMEFHKKKWLHANHMDEMVMENGFAKCIFPKRNRIVFIANDAYHMVTRVNEQSGDNLRMSLAGFFDRKKK